MRRSIESAYRQARKMEALGNLVGSVAHDFNNLLMIVSANVQIARRRGALGLDREFSAMERALKSGQSLTRQLLGVARKQPLASETIATAAWVPAARELLRASLGAKVALAVEVAPDVWPIRVDPAELELALINVAVNARDAMPNGGTFTVHAGNISFRHEDGFPIVGEFVQFTLDDTGAGMSSDVLGRAFEPLFTTKPKGMGTGLGLPQVFAFCERAGGLATIDSAIGAGTSVRLYLPRAGATNVPSVAVPEEPAVAAVSHGLCVLLVEDNDEVAAGTEALLTMMGHQVTCVFNADAALDIARSRARRLSARRRVSVRCRAVGHPYARQAERHRSRRTPPDLRAARARDPRHRLRGRTGSRATSRCARVVEALRHRPARFAVASDPRRLGRRATRDAPRRPRDR